RERLPSGRVQPGDETGADGWRRGAGAPPLAHRAAAERGHELHAGDRLDQGSARGARPDVREAGPGARERRTLRAVTRGPEELTAADGEEGQPRVEDSRRIDRSPAPPHRGVRGVGDAPGGAEAGGHAEASDPDRAPERERTGWIGR